MSNPTLGELYDRATFAFDARDYLTAASLLEELVAVEPDNVSVRLLLARAYFHSARLERAETAVRDVLERAPGEYYAYLLLGRVLQRQRRHDEASGPLRLAAAMSGDPEVEAIARR